MAAARLNETKIKIIKEMGTYLALNRMNSLLNSDANFEEAKLDHVTKSKIGMVVGLLHTVILNVDENNRGPKSQMLDYISQLIKDNQKFPSKAGFSGMGGMLNLYLDRVKNLVEKMEDKPAASFKSSPPEVSQDLKLAQNVMMLCRYSWDHFTILTSRKTKEHRTNVIVSVIEKLFSQESVDVKYKFIKSMRDKDCDYNEIKRESVPQTAYDRQILLQGGLYRLLEMLKKQRLSVEERDAHKVGAPRVESEEERRFGIISAPSSYLGVPEEVVSTVPQYSYAQLVKVTKSPIHSSSNLSFPEVPTRALDVPQSEEGRVAVAPGLSRALVTS